MPSLNAFVSKLSVHKKEVKVKRSLKCINITNKTKDSKQYEPVTTRVLQLECVCIISHDYNLIIN